MSKLQRQDSPDDRVALPLDPEEALKALLAVKPDDQDSEKGATPNGSHPSQA